MAAGYEMRVGDAEREAAAAELREHFASGRLNQDELDERLSAAFAAKTRSDLNALFTDLPSSGPGWASATTAGGRASGTGQWAPGVEDVFAGWQARRNAWRASAGRKVGRLVLTAVMLWALFIVGILGIFGIGTARPLGIVLIIATFALLRWLLYVLFGHRRMGGRGRRCCGPWRRF